MSEKLPDSIVSAEQRAAKIRVESAEIERVQAELAAKQAEHRVRQDAEDVERLGTVFGIATRDELLDRIREMREGPPVTAIPGERLTHLSSTSIWVRSSETRAA